jgi:LacI family transcriptional regulator
MRAFVVIGFGQAPAEVDHALAALDGMESPVVCITSGELRRPVVHVFFDNRSAGYDAAQCVLRAGCRRILYVAPYTTTWTRERLEGILAAVEHAGLPPNAVCAYPAHPKPWVQEEDPRVLGYDTGSAFFDGGEVPDGVVAASDGVALGFMRAAAGRDLRAGQDFAIVGIDDHPEARVHQLTTLRLPMESMGKEASRLLLRTLRGEQANLQTRIRCHVIPRASCHLEAAGSRKM